MSHDYEYLGDGVYASFDGYHIWLHVGDHTNPPAVALEPQVFEALTSYRQRIQAKYRADGGANIKTKHTNIAGGNPLGTEPEGR